MGRPLTLFGIMLQHRPENRKRISEGTLRALKVLQRPFRESQRDRALLVASRLATPNRRLSQDAGPVFAGPAIRLSPINGAIDQ
ncbi:hypothetical protein AMC87_CH03373 [Rhizobium phaseoli]|nr:hypothetical protein AMC87_CH03373 [Rhizobium phaseoli]